MQSEGETWFVTDVKELYDIVKNIYVFLFEKIIYIEGNNKETFDGSLVIKDLIDYFLSLNRKQKYYDHMKRLYETKENQNSSFILSNFNDLVDLDIEKNEMDRKIWNTFCLLLLDEIKDEPDREKYILYKLAVYSVLLHLTDSPEYVNKYLELVLSDKSTTADNMYFVWNQFKRKKLLHIAVLDSHSDTMCTELYDRAYDMYRTELGDELSRIPREERDKNLVLVSTIQLLDENHAPTRTVIERVRALLTQRFDQGGRIWKCEMRFAMPRRDRTEQMCVYSVHGEINI